MWPHRVVAFINLLILIISICHQSFLAKILLGQFWPHVCSSALSNTFTGCKYGPLVVIKETFLVWYSARLDLMQWQGDRLYQFQHQQYLTRSNDLEKQRSYQGRHSLQYSQLLARIRMWQLHVSEVSKVGVVSQSDSYWTYCTNINLDDTTSLEIVLKGTLTCSSWCKWITVPGYNGWGLSSTKFFSLI